MKYKAKNLKQKAQKKMSKKTTVILAVVLAVCTIGGGVWYYLGHNSSEPVYVYPFQFVGMTEYWGDSQESYGPVTTDKIQTVFLSETQTVTEICVQEGDQVKKGDLLMTFDTTLSDLQLERKRLEVEKLKLQLKEAESQLWEINNMEPMEPPDIDFPEPGEPDLGDPIDKKGYQISDDAAYDGSSQAKALTCWIKDGYNVGWSLFEELRQRAEEYQTENAAAKPPSSASALLDDESQDSFEDSEDPSEESDDPSEESQDPSEESQDPSEDDEDSSEESQDPSEDDEDSSEESQDPSEDDDDSSGESQEPSEDDEDPSEDNEDPSEEDDLSEEAEDPSEETEDPTEETDPPEIVIGDFYVVFKTTQGNTTGGMVTMRQGLHINVHDRLGYSFSFFDASMVPDYYPSLPDAEIPTMPDINFGSGMTAAQIAQMRSEQQKKIKDLTFDIKMGEAEYKIMQTEISDGNIYASIDGSVISLLTEEEAKKQQQPVLKVSGGGGFYVEGYVNELDKDQMQIGQEVTINDWRNGATYTGKVKSIGDFPNMGDVYTGMGNPNASYYPFHVYVDGSADLQEGSYVNMSYSAGGTQNGVYLENPFVRKEQGRSYVMVQGENGRLEQRFVTTGKSLWGSYTEILSGLTAEDLVAFPYGKNVKPGVAVEEGDLSNLYG